MSARRSEEKAHAKCEGGLFVQPQRQLFVAGSELMESSLSRLFFFLRESEH